MPSPEFQFVTETVVPAIAEGALSMYLSPLDLITPIQPVPSAPPINVDSATVFGTARYPHILLNLTPQLLAVVVGLYAFAQIAVVGLRQ